MKFIFYQDKTLNASKIVIHMGKNAGRIYKECIPN